MTVKKLIGQAPSQAPRNRDLGSMAYQDANNYYSTAVQPTFRNRIINGDSRVDQRFAGAAFLSSSNGAYIVDRWRTISTATNKLTYQKNMGTVASPAGFSSYLGVSVTATDTSNAQWYGVEQAIEGTMVSDFGFGTSNASPVTLSFWVRSSITGTYAVNLYTSSTRSFIAEYSINAPNTWEYKSVVIPGDPSSSVTTDNGWAMTLRFDLGTYTTANGTAGVWNNGNLMRTSRCVNLVQNAGATWYVTGVQLEKGTIATPFEFRPYSVELTMCQRYFQNRGSSTGGWESICESGQFTSSTAYQTSVRLNPEMRTAPTVTYSGNLSTVYLVRAASVYSATSLTVADNVYGRTLLFYGNCNNTGGAVGEQARMQTTAAGQFFSFSAEL